MGSWRTVVKPLEEYTQDRAEDREDKLLLIQVRPCARCHPFFEKQSLVQVFKTLCLLCFRRRMSPWHNKYSMLSLFQSLSQVPLSKWEKEESEEEEQDEGEIKVQTGTLPVARPPPLVTQTNKETEGENEQKRQRSVEAQRERERAAERGRDREKERNSSDRSVAPSSGKDRSDSSLCTDRDRDRGRERERQERKSQKENERAKVRTREEERGRDKERERDHSSIQKRNPSSSSYYSFSSTSRDTERRDISSVDQNAHKTHRDILLDLISKGKDEEQKGLLDYYHHNHKDPTQNSRRQDTPAGTHHSPSSLSHSWGKERDPLPSKSPRGPQGESEPSKPRMSSPEPELMHVGGSDEPNTWRFRSQHAASPTEPPESSQDMTSSSEREKEKRENKRRNESREEKGEWKRYKLDKVIKESKAERETRGTETERERGSRWETDRWDEEAKWWAGRELEEGERPSCSSSVSSSASQGNSKDDRRKDRKKKQKKHKKEKRQAGPELEEGELKKHKKSSKKYKEGSKEESSGEMDDRWKEEEDHAKLPFSVQKVPGFHF